MWAEYALKSIKKFAIGFRNVILVTDNDGNAIPSKLTSILPVTVIYAEVPSTCPPKLYERKGYLWQQMLKLHWIDYTDADAVLILDSDEMICRPITPNIFRDSEGRWKWYYRDWAESEFASVWKLPTEEVLKFTPKYESMVCAPFILERTITQNFINYLIHIHKAFDLYDVFFKYDMMQFSEYNAYGSYVNEFDNDTIYLRIINKNCNELYVIKSWSYGGLKEDDKKRRDALLGH